MTVEKAKALLLKKYPFRQIVRGCMYKGDYLFVAPDKDLGEFGDMGDPFFIVKEDGTIKSFVPTMDLKGFSEAMSKHQIEV